jgi:hypothetical protein
MGRFLRRSIAGAIAYELGPYCAIAISRVNLCKDYFRTQETLAATHALAVCKAKLANGSLYA